jgi:hypothetical protein
MAAIAGAKPEAARTFVGWFRPPRGVWEVYCRAPTEAAAWDRLLDLQRSGDKAVLPAGKDPNDRVAQRGLFA